MTAADDKPKPRHPDTLPRAEATRARRELASMVMLGRMAGDPFLDALSRTTTVALAVNDPRRRK